MSPQAAPAASRHANLTLEIGLLMLLSLIWGGSFTLIKVAIGTVPPLTLVAVRVTIAATVLIVMARAQGLPLPRERATWAAFSVQGLLQSAAPFTLISWGEKHIASGLAGVLNATPPLFVLLIAMMTARGRRHIDGRKIAGVGLGLAGVVMTIGFAALKGVGTAAPLAQVAVLGASLCYALAPLWGRRFAGLPATVTAAGAMSSAAALMLPAAAIIERPWTLAPTSEAIVAVLVLSVVCTALAMVIYFRLIRTLGALGTTSGSYLRAGFAMALGVLFLGESFTWSMLAGMLLIVLGVIAVTGPITDRCHQIAKASELAFEQQEADP
ncbi:permease [Aliidongia dinghuensis]|uniref:Permease n=1 Tax=Aliidongia dinghuensis TaxID=1867774 RepID=A0A8J3E6I1_9PROT|nr:EamA family transporter [Aliidongia dinghuensis]GGF44845.1 permease [Aliidongia dinghuensis]